LKWLIPETMLVIGKEQPVVIGVKPWQRQTVFCSSLTLRFGCVVWKVGGVKTKVSVFLSPQNLKTRYSASLVQNQWQETKLITYYDFTASSDRKEADEATQKLGHSLWLSHSKWLLWALMEAATNAGCARTTLAAATTTCLPTCASHHAPLRAPSCPITLCAYGSTSCGPHAATPWSPEQDSHMVEGGPKKNND
jgi:hypothetical protein